MTARSEITLAGPLGAESRAQLAERLAQAQGPVLLAISSGGLPLDEIGQAPAAAELAAIAADVAARAGSVALLSGEVRGAALGIALAATHRITTPDLRAGFDDITFGLVPVAGATQRLPRLTGDAPPHDMQAGGRGLDAAQALAVGLVDHVAETDASAMARALLGAAEPQRHGLHDGRGYLAALANARPALNGAALRVADCIEMALLLPPEQGLAYERVCFADLCDGDAALGLIHATKAMATAGGGASVPIGRLGLWGEGPAAVEIAAHALRVGLTVQLACDRRDSVVKTLADLAEAQEAALQAGRLTQDEREADWARLLPQVGAEGVAGVDLVLMLDAGDLTGPRLALGVPPPAGAMALTRLDGLAEIQPLGAAPAHLAAALGLARAMGWQPVVTGPGRALSLRLAKALSDAVLWAERQGRARADIARSLAAAGIAGGEAVTGWDETALRCLGALANAGARAIAAGEAPSAAHVDAVAIAAGLMSRQSGGPMHQANRRGLLLLRRDLRLWEAGDAALWSPAPLIDDLVSEGRGFT